MGAVAYIAIWGVTSALASLAGGIVAYMKRRDHSAWAAWCFVFPPLLIAVLLLRKNPGSRPRRPSIDEEDNHELA